MSLLVVLFSLMRLVASIPSESNLPGLPVYMHYQKVFVEFGDNIGRHVESRIVQHLSSMIHTEFFAFRDYENVIREDAENHLEVNYLIMSFGNAQLSSIHIPTYELQNLPAESYKVSFRTYTNQNRTYLLASNGLPLSDHVHKNISFDRNAVHYGAVLGAYAALERVGFAFLHPLEPFIPPQLRMDTQCEVRNILGQDESCVPKEFDEVESPYWPERSFHIHTQHPLEVTEVLQGHDIPQFGPHGPHCKAFNKDHNKRHRADPSFKGVNDHAYCERWEDMVSDVDAMFEWSVANRLNKVEWLLLGNYKWGDELETRKRRFSILTGLGHQYSLLVGADVPIGNIQQHAWHMVNVRLPFAQQVAQIQERVDWIFNAGFDFLTTESGLSEFTHPECDLMVDLMSAFSTHVNVTWGREAGIKVHCSGGQSCSDYPDPRTGDPLNFNFLPTYAHSSMGVFPHTVQLYALDDPSAGTYGNQNFSYIEEYLVYEAKKGNRSVVFYGETAYWVNYDVDVPLFLPLYAQRRQHDLRRIAVREVKEGFRMQGQMNFDSGWEWGYWLNDVVTARASWDPLLPPRETILGEDASVCSHDQLSAEDVCREPSEYNAADDQWSAYERSLAPVVKIFGPYAGKVRDLLVQLTKAQAEVLIHGRVQGRESPNLRKLSGIAYMSGGDTWVDVPRMFGLAFTQPDKVHLKETSDPDWPHVMEILREMDTVFGGFSANMRTLVADITRDQQQHGGEKSLFEFGDMTWKLLHELEDCVHMLSLRASQLVLLYESKDPGIGGADEAVKIDLQKRSRVVLQAATEVVRQREENYRTAVERVGAWRDNPTVYRFGYLWSVHSLYYWWRDQGLAEQGSLQSEYSPCYLNRMDSTEVVVGWGKYALEMLRNFINRYTFTSSYPLEIVNCLSPPSKEYEFPKNLYHFD